MESTIIKKLSPNRMMDIFEKMNIRWCEPVKKGKLDESDFDTPISYKIVIRHIEGEDANKMFNKAILNLK